MRRIGWIALLLLAVACESAQERELKRLQTEQLRLQIQAQTEQARLAAERADQERTALAAARRAEEERKEREAKEREAEQLAQAERQRRDAVDRFVQARAQVRVAAIVRPLMGADPGITVLHHDAERDSGPFEAAVRVDYRGGISGDALAFTGRLIRAPDGQERFRYDALAPQIIGRLSFIGVDEKDLRLLANGQAVVTF